MFSVAIKRKLHRAPQSNGVDARIVIANPSPHGKIWELDPNASGLFAICGRVLTQPDPRGG